MNGTSARNEEGKIHITANNLQVAYDDFIALRCEKLDLRGRVVALLGHNGAGKSTLIKSILGLLPYRTGNLEITYAGANGPFRLIAEEHMAFCPETGSVFADISVESYIKLWCRMKHQDKNYYKKGGARYIDVLQIAPLMKKLGRELSKGQRRRVQTAIGFLTAPRLFLFDEPFDGLDVQKTSELTDIIVNESEHMAFVVSSHRMDVVERLADALIVLKEGAFLTYGSLEQVCVDLCKQSVVISNIEDNNGLLNELRHEFRTSLVNHIGSQICMTGSDFSLEALQGYLNRLGISAARLAPIRPSLVDAMNYHLKTSDPHPAPLMD